MKLFLSALSLSIGFAAAAGAQQSVLTVYTYDSFVAEWGPGPAVEAAFEETCGCDLQFVAAGDGAALLARIQLEGKRTDADIVLGLDSNLTARAAATGLLTPHNRHDEWDLPVRWDDPLFVPYDWGFFAFVYDETRTAEPPGSMEALARSDIRVVIQDPRSSTPGLGLLLWVKHAYGERAKSIWQELADNVVTVTPGWSEAYGMFLDGHAEMVLSYTTSPAYHMIAEGDRTKRAAAFAEGHYMQVEVAARLAASDQPELADMFLEFMAGDVFQGLIPTTNWMYPAKMPASGLPVEFGELVQPSKALLYSSDDAASVRDVALAEWLEALSQ
ncbi:MAG: thiamine ABC transporter substrate binding subunit [Rhodobacteraceae bacterium]|nr:thiamine ABC transporter substrate binding subunit [Paracoccaceae bacterium]